MKAEQHRVTHGYLTVTATHDLTILDMDAGLGQLLGYPDDAWKSKLKRLTDLFFQEDHSSKLQLRGQFIVDGLSRFTCGNCRLATVDQSIVWVNHYAVVSRDDHGIPITVTDHFFDVTEQVMREKKASPIEPIFYNAERYQAMFERSGYAMLILENDIIEECNDAAVQLLGYDSQEQFRNLHPSRLSPERQPDGMLSAEKVQINNQMAIDNGSYRFEWDHLHKNGEIIPVDILLTSIPSRQPDVRTLHVIWRDIRVRRKAFAELALQYEMLENNNRELMQFSYIASHDLQEPLRTVVNFSELLHQEYADRLDDEGKLYLKFLLDSSKRMQILVRDLMEYSRIGRSSEVKQIDTQELVQNILHDLATIIQEKQATVTVAKLPILEGYETELRVLFQNLISNAMKFNKPGVPPLIEISIENQSTEWLFAVKDNGIGIDPKNHEKVFVIFKRLHRQAEYGGTGVGLANCRKIVTLHQGKIWVDSASGSGATFNFTIPKSLIVRQ